MEKMMKAASPREPTFRRIAVIAAVTVVVITATLFGKRIYLATTAEAPGGTGVSEAVGHQGVAFETASITASPTIDSNPQFLFGCGDGSNGYYAERAEPTLALVRYRQMP
jgi:hypothetical protein